MDSIDIQRIIGEVAVKHGFVMDRQDPSFALVTINQLVFEDLIRQASEQISARIAEFSVSLGQFEERTAKAAVQGAATALRSELSEDLRRAAREWKHPRLAGSRTAFVLSWATIALVVAVVFVLGVWTGQFSVLVASRMR